eukprot:7169820-Pyramimonas_sp.AAC.1
MTHQAHPIVPSGPRGSAAAASGRPGTDVCYTVSGAPSCRVVESTTHVANQSDAEHVEYMSSRANLITGCEPDLVSHVSPYL